MLLSNFSLIFFIQVVLAEKIGLIIPLLMLSIFFEIFTIVDEIFLVVFWILKCLEICWTIFNFILFSFFSSGSLLFLKSIFLFGCHDHITLLEVSLIGTAASIRRSYHIVQPLREVVELKSEFTHTIHVVPLLGVWVLAEDALFCRFIKLPIFVSLIWHEFSDENITAPITLNLPDHSHFLRLARQLFRYLTFTFLSIAREPALLSEPDLTLILLVPQ